MFDGFRGPLDRGRLRPIEHALLDSKGQFILVLPHHAAVRVNDELQHVIAVRRSTGPLLRSQQTGCPDLRDDKRLGSAATSARTC